MKLPDAKDVFSRLTWLPFSGEVKPLIRLLLRRMVDVIEEPTKENTYRANTHLLIDRREAFIARMNNPSREKEFRAVWNILIIMYEDPAYCDMINEEARWFINSGWDFNPPAPDYDQLGEG
ncbi:unnamed protein product [marine sediment metagenome]|uniref:Uncharacterized protein n=1 Tax=marine sediment metagenome TaxID=412755 RepID=X0S2L4_9ZZZZ